jgi:hypothetical protein
VLHLTSNTLVKRISVMSLFLLPVNVYNAASNKLLQKIRSFSPKFSLSHEEPITDLNTIEQLGVGALGAYRGLSITWRIGELFAPYAKKAALTLDQDYKDGGFPAVDKRLETWFQDLDNYFSDIASIKN